jgi:hypothetical protein
LSAGIAYNNFGPGNSVGDSAWIFVNTGGFIATTFTTTGSGPLSSVLVDIDCSVTPVTMGLYTNAAGQPGTLLESWTAPVTVAAQIITLTSILNPVLSPGTQYWFVITIPPNSYFEWVENNQALKGAIWFGGAVNALAHGVPFELAAVIQLNTAIPGPVPLPPTVLLTLAGLALAGLTFLWMRKRSDGPAIG